MSASSYTLVLALTQTLWPANNSYSACLDEDYREGIVGDVINMENMLLDIEPDAKIAPKAEELDMDEVDEKIKEEAQSANDRDGQNDPESDIEVLETSPTFSLVALRRRNKTKRQNLQQRVRPADIVSVGTTTILYTEENGISSNDTSAGPSTQGKSGPLQAGEIVPGASRLGPVHAFLEQLKRPLGQLETMSSVNCGINGSSCGPSLVRDKALRSCNG
ncbi:hypothetical protein DAEQUDRAFT_735463 [Daedalea quercina L-15889]|uniref:Uncharacterized protein n=1 Tax=Daedalea quercina L-15889 TaxID=1314783 RepID=A0A165TD92_9APHY|nr:hypothetical protein DAEQUDRAFT_735463 [Daedalea quercina L-15889]